MDDAIFVKPGSEDAQSKVCLEGETSAQSKSSGFSEQALERYGENTEIENITPAVQVLQKTLKGIYSSYFSNQLWPLNRYCCNQLCLQVSDMPEADSSLEILAVSLLEEHRSTKILRLLSPVLQVLW